MAWYLVAHLGLFSPIWYRRKLVVAAAIAAVLGINFVYALVPATYGVRVFWVPFVEEAIKALFIYRMEEVKRSSRVLTSTAFGVVDAASQLPNHLERIRNLSNSLALGYKGSELDIFFAVMVICLLIVLMHAFIGLFYLTPTKNNQKYFFVPPTIAHLLINLLGARLVG